MYRKITDKTSHRKEHLQRPVLPFMNWPQEIAPLQQQLSDSQLYPHPAYNCKCWRFKQCLLILDILEIHLLIKKEVSHHLEIIRPQRSKWQKDRNPQLQIIFKFCSWNLTLTVIIKPPPSFEIHVLPFQIQNKYTLIINDYYHHKKGRKRAK